MTLCEFVAECARLCGYVVCVFACIVMTSFLNDTGGDVRVVVWGPKTNQLPVMANYEKKVRCCP